MVLPVDEAVPQPSRSVPSEDAYAEDVERALPLLLPNLGIYVQCVKTRRNEVCESEEENVATFWTILTVDTAVKLARAEESRALVPPVGVGVVLGESEC